MPYGSAFWTICLSSPTVVRDRGAVVEISQPSFPMAPKAPMSAGNPSGNTNAGRRRQAACHR